VVLKRVAQELSPVFALKNPKAEDIQDIEAYLEKVQKQLALLKKRVKINAS
jgi:hypothetical protein